jgi:repressor LexA
MATTDTTAPKPLTARQREVVRLVRRHVAKHGFPPTLRELASELDIAPSAIAGHLAAAERKGVLRRASRTARGMTLTNGDIIHGKKP